MLIDVGVETYSRKTFGPRRYEIWTMQSGYHNLPVIDGHQQQPGPDYRARDVACELTDDRAQLTLDLAAAYPTEAGVRRWRRTLRLERGPEARVVLEDAYDLVAAPRGLALHLMAAGAVDASQPGLLLCASPEGGRPLAVRYDPQIFAATVEEITIEDARLRPVWGERIYRVILTALSPQAQGNWTLTVQAGSAS